MERYNVAGVDALSYTLSSLIILTWRTWSWSHGRYVTVSSRDIRTVAASLDHRSQYMDGPPAIYKKESMTEVFHLFRCYTHTHCGTHPTHTRARTSAYVYIFACVWYHRQWMHKNDCKQLLEWWSPKIQMPHGPMDFKKWSLTPDVSLDRVGSPISHIPGPDSSFNLTLPKSSMTRTVRM